MGQATVLYNGGQRPLSFGRLLDSLRSHFGIPFGYTHIRIHVYMQTCYFTIGIDWKRSQGEYCGMVRVSDVLMGIVDE